MALRNIRVDGDSILSMRAKEITEVTDRIRTLAGDMLETMYDAEGVGLAGPQIGILKRIIVLDVSENADDPYVLLNPEIVFEEGSQTDYEGCLSVPGKKGAVTRPRHIRVKAKNLMFEDIEIDAEDLFARALCHEIDHLEGILYTSKVEGELKDTDAPED